jgi:hypothetical protein
MSRSSTVVFVTEDGAETDLDLGTERFVDENLSRNMTIRRARFGTRCSARSAGQFLGATVQVIPHITNEIKARIGGRRRRTADVVISDRRHGGRHRVAAVSRGDPPVPARGRAERLLRHAGAFIELPAS